MKIGIDVRLWNETGVGRYIRNLVRELSLIDTKNRYVLFCLPKDAESIEELVSSSKVQKKTKNSSWKIVPVDIHWHSVTEQARFPLILDRERLNVMHFPYFSVPILYRRPYVMTMHDTIVSEMSTGRASTLPSPVFKTKRIAYRLIVHEALKKAQRVIVPTKTVKAQIIEQEHIPAEKIEVTYEGAEISSKYLVSSIKRKIKANSNQLKAKNYLLYVGNAYPHKNLGRLCEAFHEFKIQNSELRRKNKELQDTKLVLVGKEDYFYKRLKREMMLIGRDIVFTGFVPDDELIQLYKNAKAVVLPSLAEGFGLPAVEAMSSGVLVACSDIPVFHEICGDAAVYFNPTDIQDIAEKLKEICSYNATSLKKRTQLGKKQAEKFSWKKMAQQTLKIYENSARVRSN